MKTVMYSNMKALRRTILAAVAAHGAALLEVDGLVDSSVEASGFFSAIVQGRRLLGI